MSESIRMNQDITGNPGSKKPFLVKMAEERRRKEDIGRVIVRKEIPKPSAGWLSPIPPAPPAPIQPTVAEPEPEMEI